MLQANLQLHLSRLELDTAFEVAPGEVVALLGPNASGKSTTLRALMGLLPISGGRVVLDDLVLEDPAAGVRLAPEDRQVGLMFQDYLLFPHLTALENVAFGLRATGVEKSVARQRAGQALERLGLSDLTGIKPGRMSGGQQQRVAMARALVTDPRLLLLDEPLAALDVSTKTDVRRVLRSVLRESRAANVLVTHDLVDAVALGDRMIVIDHGKIVQEGTPAEVTARPRSQYVADLTGVNLLHGTADDRVLELEGGGRLLCDGTGHGPVFAVVSPAEVSVSREQPAEGSPNSWRGRVGAIDLMGDRVRVRIEGSPTVTAEVRPAAVDELKLDDGGDLWASVPPHAVVMYPSAPSNPGENP